MHNPHWPLLALFFVSSALPARTTAQTWEVVTSGINTNLRGVSTANSLDGKEVTIWAAGSNGVVLISTNSGKTWNQFTVKGGEQLDFRGIVAFDERSAYLMASGEGEKSRIYKTLDGGKSWQMQFTDTRKELFLDAIQCLSETECYALGDPLDGQFLVLQTKDGEHWKRLWADGLQALPQEGAFAASNSCLSVARNTGTYFVTGGPAARVFHSADLGRTWSVTNTPAAKGNASAGAFSIAVDGNNVVIVGGDYRDASRGTDSAAYSSDGGVHWKRAAAPASGFRSAVAFLDGQRLVAVGTNGCDFSGDQGVHWTPAGSVSLNALTVHDISSVWGVGPNGLIARFHNPVP